MKNILVVDDEETILITLVEWFASAHATSDFNILTAFNGVEAVKALASSKIDLLITDLNMPKMDGFELLTHMNNDYKSTPIIVMSAFATPEIKDKVKNMGATIFIPKPFSFDDLEEIDFKAIVSPPPARKDGSGVVSGISLQSFLQLINIESKTCTLTIRSEGKTGQMYLDKGDLMNAKTENNESSKAAQEIISWNDEGLTIEIEDGCAETEKKIKYTIMSLLMEAARMADEQSAKKAGVADEDEAEAKKVKEATAAAAAAMDETQVITSTKKAAPAVAEPPPIPKPPPAPTPPPAAPPAPAAPPTKKKAAPEVDLGKLDLVKVQTKLKEFSALDGFSGAVLSTSNGDILQTVNSEGSEVNLEQAAVFANNILSTSHSSTMNMKMGSGSKLVQVDTEAGHMLISGQAGLNIMLILGVSSSLGLGKIMVTKTLNDITADL
jgi:CheY-like chemotaxis protein